MTAKSQPELSPSLRRNIQYSGTVSNLLYNWPIFAGIFLFGAVAVVSGTLLSYPWNWIFISAGVLALIIGLNILIVSFVVYDWGPRREYDRLAELSNLSDANVIIDVTCGKLRGTQGLLSRVQNSHYLLLDIYDPEKMTDSALRRARELSVPLETDRRIYRRSAPLDRLPIPHNWADVIYCSFSLHEIADATDRQKLFDEFARVLKANGKLLIAEHGRDLPNLLAFGPGVFSFFSSATWTNHITEAGLIIKQRERWRGLVHLWVAERKARQ